MKVLYITYDGAMDPLGQSQVLPYLLGLSSKGAKFVLLTFEKKEKLEDKKGQRELNNRLKNSGIDWVILRYHKSPKVLATFYDMIMAFFRIFFLIGKGGIDFIHARGYVACYLAYLIKKVKGAKYIFDMRSFWADERVDAGMWPKDHWLYKIVKKLEKMLLLNSDEIVVLAHRSKNIVRNLDYMKSKKFDIDVIPTCVDLKRFNIQDKQENILNLLNIKDRFILLYLGSIGTWYMLDEMIAFFKVLKGRIKNSFFLFLSNTEKETVEDEMQRHGVRKEDFSIRNIAYQEVPRWLSVADVSVIFRKPHFSKKSSCPTKFGESLACGIPVVVNSEVGDTDEIVRSNKIGVVIDRFNLDSYQKAIDELLILMENREKRNGLRMRCHDAAEKFLSLDKGVSYFHKIYKDLVQK